MSTHNRFFIFLFLLLSTGIVDAQTSVYPFTVSTTITPPYTTNVSDYVGTSAYRTNVQVTFNDYNEPYWESRLRVTIEGNGITIQTRPDFRPAPLILYPGLNTITGNDLSIYFNATNTIIQGTTANEVFNNNKLPEGFYTLCVEVIDYELNKVLSNKSCAFIQMQLPNVPIIITPSCASTVSANAPQQILFSWTGVYSSLSTAPAQYQLTLYEITNPNANPQYAIQNNQALLVFTSDWSAQTNYLFTNADPLLDIGKRHIFRVQSKFEDGSIQLKNNGYSQVCDFYFGYPIGGSIALLKPLDAGNFCLSDPLLFSWTKPSNLISNQQVSYKLDIVKILNGQTAEDAFVSGNLFYSQSYPETFVPMTYQVLLPIKLEPMYTYAWRVQAYTGTQLIAESNIQTFVGPPVLEKFYAGTHIVYVDQTFNNTITSLSGVGRVSLGNGKEQVVNFNDVFLQYVAGNFTMGDGEIIQALSDTSVITLNPKQSENNSAYFHPSQIKLNRYGLYINGFIQWPFPHAITSSQLSVLTPTNWYDYNTYKLIGSTHLTAFNNFDLLEPAAYRLELASYSDVIVYKNEYALNIHGNVVCPPNIKGAGVLVDPIRLPFNNALQLYYISNDNALPVQPIVPVTSLAFQLHPLDYIIDLSDLQSPGKNESDVLWKGIYFLKTNLHFLPAFDSNGQMSFISETNYLLEPTAADSNVYYLDMYGQTFRYIRNFSGYPVSFNTFPAHVTDFRINIFHDAVEESYLKGSLIIPFISTTKPFHYTSVLTSAGLYPGYMTDLDEFEFVYHSDKSEESINIKILSAVFTDKERLDFSLNMDWPYLQANIEGLTGFRAWGDYQIGFYTRKGTTLLSDQIQGQLTEYPFTITSIGAGSGSGKYAFGFSGNVRINEEVSGDNGPPLVNIYSLVANSLLPFEEDSDAYQEALDNGSSPSEAITAISIDHQKQLLNQQLQTEVKNSANGVSDIAASIPLTQYQSAPASLQLASNSTQIDTTLNESVRRGLRAKLNDKEYEIVEQFFTEFIRLGVDVLTKPIENVSDTLTKKINKSIDKSVIKLDTFITREVNKIIDSIVVKVVRTFVRDGYDPTEDFLVVGDTIAKELSNEINRSIKASINVNIKKPISDFIRAQLVDSTRAFMVRELSGMTDELLNGNYETSVIISRITNKLPEFLLSITNNLIGFVKPKNIASMLEKTALDAIRNIDLGAVAEKVTDGFIENGPRIVTSNLARIASAQINAMVSTVFAQTPILNAIAPPSIKMNFDNIGEKISSGRIDQIITLDPTNIAINTKFVSFKGKLRQVKDTIYGNAWRGAFAVTIKQPKPFGVDAIYLSGKKNEHEYWFCQVSPGDPEGKVGGSLSKDCKPFSTPATIGPVQIVAGTGRVYKGMAEISNGTDIVPDPSIAFGAFFNLVLFDTQNKGKTVRVKVEAEYILSEDDHFVVDFNGEVQVMNNAVSILEKDPTAMVSGELHLYYNSLEDHFLGEGAIIIQKPGVLCGQGSFLIETKPGFWRVAIGERTFPVQMILACNSWGIMGWLYVDQHRAEIGGGVGYYVNIYQGLNVGPLSLGIGVNAGVEVKVWVGFTYNPRVTLDELGVEAHGFIHVFIDYSTPLKSGSLNLVDIDIYLGGIVHINPKPTYLEGYIRGSVAVLSFGVDFNLGFHKNI
jgi:hypothetical protein